MSGFHFTFHREFRRGSDGRIDIMRPIYAYGTATSYDGDVSYTMSFDSRTDSSEDIEARLSIYTSSFSSIFRRILEPMAGGIWDLSQPSIEIPEYV